jgi:hypothetical protein
MPDFSDFGTYSGNFASGFRRFDGNPETNQPKENQSSSL